jgi:hypothetical protein
LTFTFLEERETGTEGNERGRVMGRKVGEREAMREEGEGG